ncbi:MAG: hypothetical protein NT056_01675 [Proteobacteria bacterium]|nr:hypothetical protein [Pseudomonadota bacterium]
MRKNIYLKIGLSGLTAALIGVSIYFGIFYYHGWQIQKRIAGITPSFRGAKNMYLLKLNRENVGQRFFSIDDYRIKHELGGAYAYVVDLPVYVKDADGKTKGFVSYWGYNQRHGNWVLVRVGRLSEEKMTKTGSQTN